MTAFSPSDLPSTVNTLEKLLVWAATVAQHLYPTDQILEAPGVDEYVAVSAPWYLTATGSPQWRCISRQSILLSPNWQRGEAGIWEFAQPFGSLTIPPEFKD
ncbi:hypothetical protein HNI00_07290 [Thermoleptolyngbya oregonensis NK1-22]|uniref:Uncharacterized protein n=1 Tax=Thermoleptolyngbya oregonensis NK1-22 TaxID=2547457 RepID=A0AA96YAD4_9CYAN|nr:hypothetical protein [Thermoleptolyngbya oregonensis]WOB42980.1 hypothetical protein HNI00_07290 [Thermoleptolyngbya oregonensis NK1-22]